jgi:hypothetical protein
MKKSFGLPASFGQFILLNIEKISSSKTFNLILKSLFLYYVTFRQCGVVTTKDWSLFN